MDLALPGECESCLGRVWWSVESRWWGTRNGRRHHCSGPLIKVCPRCRERLPRTSEFWYAGGRRDGLDWVCKACKDEARRTAAA